VRVRALLWKRFLTLAILLDAAAGSTSPRECLAKRQLGGTLRE
jgi:hypothetical protein